MGIVSEYIRNLIAKQVEDNGLVVYVPMAQDQTQHALIELEAAGVIMQPGPQPPSRNTRLAVVARNSQKGVLGDEIAAPVYPLYLVNSRGLTSNNHICQSPVIN